MQKEKTTSKLPKLTKKQRGFVKDYVISENGTQAAKKNYNVGNDLTAAVIASENLNKPYIAEAIENLKKSIADGIPDDLLLQKHLEGLDATSVRFTPEGEQIDVDDYAIRHKYIESAYKLKKLIGGDETPVKPAIGNTYNFIFSAEAQEEIKAMEAKIKERLLQKNDSPAN